MGNSLREQLLKAGLVDKKQVSKAKHDKRVSNKRPKGQRVTAVKPKEDSVTREERLAYAERNRELNRQRELERKKRESLAQVKQLIKDNRLTLKELDDDEPFYFVVGKKVKKMFLSKKISNDLTQGRLAIANLDGRFEIIPENAALQIAERNEKALVFFNGSTSDPKPSNGDS